MNENQSWVKFNKKQVSQNKYTIAYMINLGHILCSFYIIASLSLQDYFILSLLNENRCLFLQHDKTHILSFSEDLLTLGESVSFSNSRSKGGRVASRRRGREGCGRADEKRGKSELHCC